MARGKKTCPACSKELGARAMKCECGHDFAPKKEIVRNKVETPPIVEVELPEDVAPQSFTTMTKEEHADRVLSYGTERAKLLLKMARWEKKWHHVDWNRVAAKMGEAEEPEDPAEEIEEAA
jgi:hypothetical protein